MESPDDTARVAEGAPSLQPCVSTDLAEFTKTRAAQNLERLAGDRDLVFALALRHYEGPDWRRFAAVLAEYGYQVMSAWISSGRVFAKCAAIGIGLGGLEAPPRSTDDAAEIAGETVARAIRAFREKVLIPGRWDPSKGASLRTYFVGQCLFQFANVFRAWVSEQDIPPVDLDTLVKEFELQTPRKDMVHLAEFSQVIAQLKGVRDDDPRRIRALVAMGYTHADIAEMLNTTAKAIELKLYRAQKGGEYEGSTTSHR